MTSSDTSFAYFENLNISKTEQDSEKPKKPFRFIWKCCFVALEIESTIFCCNGTLMSFKIDYFYGL